MASSQLLQCRPEKAAGNNASRHTWGSLNSNTLILAKKLNHLSALESGPCIKDRCTKAQGYPGSIIRTKQNFKCNRGKKRQKPILIIPHCRGKSSWKYHALSNWKQGTGAFLLQIRTLAGTSPLLGVQICILGCEGGSLMLMHISALIAQPLVAQCTQALCKRWLWTLWAALEEKQKALFLKYWVNTLTHRTIWLQGNVGIYHKLFQVRKKIHLLRYNQKHDWVIVSPYRFYVAVKNIDMTHSQNHINSSRCSLGADQVLPNYSLSKIINRTYRMKRHQHKHKEACQLYLERPMNSQITRSTMQTPKLQQEIKYKTTVTENCLISRSGWCENPTFSMVVLWEWSFWNWRVRRGEHAAWYLSSSNTEATTWGRKQCTPRGGPRGDGLQDRLTVLSPPPVYPCVGPSSLQQRRRVSHSISPPNPFS